MHASPGSRIVTKPRPPCIGCCEEVLTKKYDNGCIFTLQILVVESTECYLGGDLFNFYMLIVRVHNRVILVFLFCSRINVCIQVQARACIRARARTHTHTSTHIHHLTEGTSDKESLNTTRWESRRHWADVSAIWKPHAESFIVNKTF